MNVSFWIRVGWLALCALPAAAMANDGADRFCLRALEFEKALDAAAVPRLREVVETPVPEHDIFFFDVTSSDGTDRFSARLIGDMFVPLNDGFPANDRNHTIVTTPDGDVIGVGGPHGHRSIYRMDGETGRFDKMRLDGPEDLARTRDVAWSTPLDAPILMTGGHSPHPDRGAVLVLEGDRALPLKGLDRWVTHITDFPSLDLTVMATEITDRIYVIDADRTLHELVELDLGGGRFIGRTLFLRDPPRLLLEANSKRLFLIRLERKDGVWRPSATHDWSDLLDGIPLSPVRGTGGAFGYDPDKARYLYYGERYRNLIERLLGHFLRPFRESRTRLFEVGLHGLERIDVPGPARLRALPHELIYRIDRPLLSEVLGRRTIRMPIIGATVELSDERISVTTADGDVQELDRSVLGPERFHPHGNAWYLASRGEILLQTAGTFFLLRDRAIPGRNVCG